ncbi:potassium channel subfamily t member 1, partial [Plakobranchus ocellatus]
MSLLRYSVNGKLFKLIFCGIHVCLVFIIIKVLLCALYVTRVCLDDVKEYACDGSPCNVSLDDSDSSQGFTSTNINWYVLLWVQRPLPLWMAQTVLSMISFIMHAVLLFITSK